MQLPIFEDIEKAHKHIRDAVRRTPVLTSSFLNELTGAQLFFKCENLQKVGAFKFRGATNAVRRLSRNELSRGVATHSSGNHAQALALAARQNGAKAYIVMPNTSPQVKVDAVKGYGAEVIFCEPNQAAREATLEDVVARTGATFVHPYNNFNVICGQGTAAKELIEDTDALDIVMSPVGGGGLLSGTSIVAKAMLRDVKVIAGEPKGADDAYRSLQIGTIQPSVSPKTIADGLLTSLGEMTFEIIRNNVDEIITVSEESIITALRYVWERMKIVIEPSSAVPLAAVLDNPNKFKGKRVGIILSGGNADITLIGKLLQNKE